MREPQRSPFALQHAGGDCGIEVGAVRTRPEHSIDRRIRHRRDQPQHLGHVRGQLAQPFVHQAGERVRHRQRPGSRRVMPRRASARAISSAMNGLPPDSASIRRSVGREKPTSRCVRSIRCSAPRLRPPSPSSSAGIRAGSSSSGNPPPAGAQQADPLDVDPPEGEGDRARGRRVQPLDVVDRHQHRRRPRERGQRIAQGGRDHPRLGDVRRRIRLQEGDLQRPPLRCGQALPDGGRDRFHRSARPAKASRSRPGTRAPRARASPSPAHAHPRLEQGRLAGAGRAGQDQGGGPVGKIVEQQIEPTEFAVPAEDRFMHVAPSVRPRGAALNPCGSPRLRRGAGSVAWQRQRVGGAG